MNFLMKVQKDKLGHALVGLVLFNLGMLFFNLEHSLLIVVFVAGAKEIYDYFNREHHTPDFWDFIATVLLPLIFTILFYFEGVLS